jgi:uncharacterized coiled-coil protein SlyX
MDERMDRVSVAEAASRLGITSDAIRQRIRRGTIAHERDKDGAVYVYIHPDETRQDERQDDYRDELIEELRNRIAFQERELERKDTLLMTLMQRIPELEASSEPPEARQTPGEGPDGVGDPAPNADETERRPSWWRRMFRP